MYGLTSIEIFKALYLHTSYSKNELCQEATETPSRSSQLFTPIVIITDFLNHHYPMVGFFISLLLYLSKSHFFSSYHVHLNLLLEKLAFVTKFTT